MFYIIKALFLAWMVLPFSIFAADNFLVPSEIIQGYLKNYSQSEKVAIEKDRRNIRELSLSQAEKGQKHLIYVATAGGPGAGKTTILETYIHNQQGFVYVDPDQRALKYMINTYLQDINNYAISQNNSYQSLLNEGYIKWRGASNYIANTILNEAYSKELAIAHGTTSTNKAISSFYKKLKDKGYKIILLLCASPEEDRLRAIVHQQKNQCFVQASNEDLKQKGEMFFENFPLYFKLADEIQFFWVDDFAKGSTKVGEYSRSSGFKYIHHDFKKLKDAYESFRKQH